MREKKFLRKVHLLARTNTLICLGKKKGKKGVRERNKERGKEEMKEKRLV